MSRHPGTFLLKVVTFLVIPMIVGAGCTCRKPLSFTVSKAYQQACQGQSPADQTVYVKADGSVNAKDECVVISRRHANGGQGNFVRWLPEDPTVPNIRINFLVAEDQLNNLPFQHMSCSKAVEGFWICTLEDCPGVGGGCRTVFKEGYEAEYPIYFAYAPRASKGAGPGQMGADPGIRIDP